MSVSFMADYFFLSNFFDSCNCTVTASYFLPRILIGAPKAQDANLKGVTEPGSLWRCDVPFQSFANCSQFTVDGKLRQLHYLFRGSELFVEKCN